MEFDKVINNDKYRDLIIKFSYKKFNGSSLISVMEFDDFLQIVYIKLYNYLPKFNKDKCKLSTYICLIIKSVYKTELEKIFTQKNDITTELMRLDYNSENNSPTHEIIKSNFDVENEMYMENENIFLNQYVVYLEKELDKQVLKLLYEGYNQKEIRTILNTTRARIDKSVARIRENLKFMVS